MSVSTYAKQILESDEAFRNQFNPEHPTYHGKTSKDDYSTKPVPVNTEKKIPDSMKGPEVVLPSGGPPVVDYGEKYEQLMIRRTALGDLKKQMSKICPPIERILKLQLKAAKKSKVSQKLLDAIEKFEEQKEEAICGVEEFLETFSGDSELDKRTCERIKLLTSGAMKDYPDKESYGDFVMEVRKITQQIFKDSRSLLQEIKEIKRACAIEA